ncbi:calcium-binding protein [Azospirillum brasilense]|nr:calcium-binding protein [Azospirillum brasilense]
MALRFAERIGSKDGDAMAASSNTVFFGLQGNDVFYGGYGIDFVFFLGGAGDDTYSIQSPGAIVIADSGGSSDQLIASGIGVSRPTTYAATIDGRHLVVGDTKSGQLVYVLNYLDPQFKIEKITLSDSVHSYDSIISLLPKAPGFIGNLSWEAFTDRMKITHLNTPDVNEALGYYLNREALLQTRATIDYRKDPTNRVAVTTGGASVETAMAAYTGPVAGVVNQHIGTDAGEAIRGSSRADFINGLAGDDAIDGRNGDDVLDGGLGSNFLTGGWGTDTFFVDGRSGGVTWSTVTDLEAGEWVTTWGWKEGVSKLTWQEMGGVEGYKGATAHIDLDGNGSIDMSMTVSGQSSGSILTTPGQVEGNGYLAFCLK